jgi:methionyl-tRNA synthetase
LIAEVLRNVSEEGASYTPKYNSMYSQPKAKFFKISGFVSHAKNDDKFYYQSCPDCRKKVSEDMGGYRCENCSKSFSMC